MVADVADPVMLNRPDRRLPWVAPNAIKAEGRRTRADPMHSEPDTVPASPGRDGSRGTIYTIMA
jgi:hypothetical protein